MSTEREFVTIEQRPRWPALAGFAAVGALITGLALAVIRGGGSDAEAAKITDVAAKPSADALKAAALTEPINGQQAAQLLPAAATANASDPNLIRGTEQAKDAMVPGAVVERYKERTLAAEKKSKQLQGEIAALKSRVRELTDEKEAMRRAQLPPPPTSEEEVLQMLAPVLAGKVQ